MFVFKDFLPKGFELIMKNSEQSKFFAREKRLSKRYWLQSLGYGPEQERSNSILLFV